MTFPIQSQIKFRILASTLAGLGVLAIPQSFGQETVYSMYAYVHLRSDDSPKTIAKARKVAVAHGASVIESGVYEEVPLTLVLRAEASPGLLERLLQELSSIATLEQLHRERGPSDAKVMDLRIEDDGLAEEAESLSVKNQPATLAMVKEKRQKISDALRAIEAGANRAHIAVLVRPSSDAPPAKSKQAATPEPPKPRRRTGTVIFAAIAEDELLHEVPEFSDFLVGILTAGGVSVKRVPIVAGNVVETSKALSRSPGAKKADSTVVAMAEVDDAGTEASQGDFVYSGKASIAVAGPDGKQVGAWSTLIRLTAHAPTKAEAKRRIAAQLASSLALGFDKVDSIWSGMPSKNKRAFLKKVSVTQREGLGVP